MLRVLGIPAILIALFVGAYLSTQGMRSNGPTSSAGRQEIAQANSATAGLNFNQAVPALQAYFDQDHTYVGATLPPGAAREDPRRAVGGRGHLPFRPATAIHAIRLLLPSHPAGYVTPQS